MASNFFSQVKPNNIPYNRFNLSHVSRYTLPSGKLIPNLVIECDPGDDIELHTSVFGRVTPMTHPIFDDLDVYQSYFFVPRRLIDDQFEQFYTGGPKGEIVLNMPMVRFGLLCNQYPRIFGSQAQVDWIDQLQDYGNDRYYGNGFWSDIVNMHVANPIGLKQYSPFFSVEGSLLDYLGYPIINSRYVSDGRNDELSDEFSMINNFVNASVPLDMSRWFAYWLIYDEYYRNPLLTEPITRDKTTGVRIYIRDFIKSDQLSRFFPGMQEGIDQVTFHPFEPAPVYYSDDYFTTAQPQPQLGDAVAIPLQLGEQDSDGTIHDLLLTQTQGTNTSVNQYRVLGSSSADSTVTQRKLVQQSTINQLKEAFSLQRFKEISAKFKNRFIDAILGHFGVRSSDSRLDRPEYLGGSSIPYQISAVLNTTEGSDMSPLGSEAGHGSVSGQLAGFRYRAEEPGIIIGLVSIRPRATYFQGVDRHLLREDRFDFYWPEFQNIGMQPIYRDELFVTSLDRDSEENFYDFRSKVFGYNSRYSERKFMPNRLHGLFKTDYLDWTTARKFRGNQMPSLSQEFLDVDNEDINRIFAYNNDYAWSNNFMFEQRWNISKLAKMQYFSESY